MLTVLTNKGRSLVSLLIFSLTLSLFSPLGFAYRAKHHPAKKANAVRFIVMGDWGRQGKMDQTKVAKMMAKEKKADFLLVTGDNFYEDGVKSVTDSQWTLSFENVYTAKTLQVPWYVVLGNHDYRGNAQAEVDYTQHSNRWKMPARYYSYDVQIDDSTTATFFVLDTSPFITSYQKEDKKYHVLEQPIDRQLHWLDSALANCKSQWKFAAGHHPVYAAGEKHGDTPEMIAQVLPLFKKYNVQAYFCGHEHNLEHLKTENMDFFVSGGGSEGKGAATNAMSLYSEASCGFLTVSLTSKELKADFTDSTGRVVNTSTVTR